MKIGRSSACASAALLAAFCCVRDADSFQRPTAFVRNAIEGAKQIGAGAAVAVAVVLVQPLDAANALPALSAPLQSAVVETSDATYPVLRALTSSSSDGISPLANKVATVLTTKVPTDKATTALERGIDAFLGIPDEDVESFANIVRESYEGVSPDSCASVRVPTEALSRLSSSAVAAAVDGDKLKAASERAAKALESFPTTDGGAAICLPSSEEGLEKLWVGQTELSLAVPRRAGREFVAAAAAAGKSVPPSELLRILPEAKALTKGLDGKTVKKFEMTSRNLDGVLKKDPSFARLLPQ